MNELETNKQAWIKPELTAILVSLEKKLERKIRKDVDDDFEKHLTAAGLDAEFKESTGLSQDENSLKRFMKDCLGLIKCLQYQGDINFDNNDFHRRILEWISRNFDNQTEAMHEYSNALMKILQNSWNVRNQWQ